MKKFLVVLLACAMIFGFAATALADDVQIVEFSDIAEQSQIVQNAIMKLAVLDVVQGNDGLGGPFRPAENLTRAEFAKIVCYLTGNVKNAEALASVASRFPDVPAGSWFTGWINMAAQSGYFVGLPDGNFRPNANITMQEVVTVALRAAGYTDKLGNSTGSAVWPGNYVTKAMNVGLLDDVTFVGSAPATRADMAVICEAVLGINMVVHINNEIAYAMSLSSGTVDPDGFSEVFYVSNEASSKREETILHKAFGGEYYDVQVHPAFVTTKFKTQTDDEEKEEKKKVVDKNEINFDETAGWTYEDFTSGEIALNFEGSYLYEGNKKFEEHNDNEYRSAEALASQYYITGGYGLTDLAAMQVQLTVIDGKEIAFVDVVSSKLDAASIYRSGSNINVDGKDYRPSATMEVSNSITKVVDYTKDFTYAEEGDGVMNMIDSDSDNDFGGRIYLDKDGRVYGVKNYNAYDGVVFGIFDSIDSNVVEWKDQNSKVVGVPGGDAKFNKTEVNKNYTLYKDGEAVKFEDLEENDLVYFLNNNGAPFFLATSPVEGELTKHNNTTVTVGGSAYNIDTDPYNDDVLFHLSDDGGSTFTKFNIAMKDQTIESYGEAEYAMAYNFNKLAYVTSNLSNTKTIGVISKIQPNQVWSGGQRKERIEEIYIINAEGEEQRVPFTSDFRDGYTYFAAPLYKATGNNAEWATTSSGESKWKAATDGQKGEKIEKLLKAGDIIQLVLDKNGAVKKIANYAAFDIRGAANAKVLASKESLTITNARGNYSTEGPFDLPSDAVIFEVATDSDNDYDDTSIIKASDVLASDFTASKIVAFDVKSGSNVAVLYLIRSVSVAKYGIVTQVGNDSNGWLLTINGTETAADEPPTFGTRNFKDRQRAVVAYNLVGGEATLKRFIAAKGVLQLPLIDADTDGTANNVKAVAGIATSTNTSGNKSITIKDYDTGKEVRIYGKDAYIFNLIDNTAVSNVNDMKNKFVLAYYDDTDFAASSIAILGTELKVGDKGDVTVNDAPEKPKSDDADIKTVFGETVTWKWDVDGYYYNEDALELAPGTYDADGIVLAHEAAEVKVDAASWGFAGAEEVVLAKDDDKVMYIRVTAEDGSNVYYLLSMSGVVKDVNITGATVTISGTVKFGEALVATVKLGEDDISSNVTYQWQVRDGVWGDAAGTGNNTATYTVPSDYIGKALRVKVTGDTGYAGTIYSVPTASVAKATFTVTNGTLQQKAAGEGDATIDLTSLVTNAPTGMTITTDATLPTGIDYSTTTLKVEASPQLTGDVVISFKVSAEGYEDATITVTVKPAV